ncbi:unnamed protein product [Pleuronectes platessa]|uniref:BHLH domain-containing protein n=1 Tax=Pleuronectes platessa TaxID=8262 RepID=A0A9N7UG44_PLEPL|nr:unnamed protein product [Pleuronectes platessa]
MPLNSSLASQHYDLGYDSLQPYFHAGSVDAAWMLNSSYLQNLNTAATECIDPSVVFPCPIAGTPKQSAGTLPSKDLGPDTLPNRSSCSESEDEDGVEDHVEEEEEGIDVVPVEKRQAVKRCDRQPAVRRLKLESSSSSGGGGGGGSGGHIRVLKQISKRLSCRTSDTEDNDKRRTQVNFLECQRRLKLKLSLVALRDEIPELANNKKAATWVILKKATECIYSMQSEEQRLLTHKEQLRRRSELLKQRLAQMQGCRA